MIKVIQFLLYLPIARTICNPNFISNFDADLPFVNERIKTSEYSLENCSCNIN